MLLQKLKKKLSTKRKLFQVGDLVMLKHQYKKTYPSISYKTPSYIEEIEDDQLLVSSHTGRYILKGKVAKYAVHLLDLE